MSEKTITWIHGDNLNPNQKALTLADDIPAIFVWDEDLLKEWNISFKRIVFIYECLLELPVTIRRGNVAEEVVKFAKEHDAINILTPESPSPRHAIICEAIKEQLPDAIIEIITPPPFVDYENDNLNLKRHSYYWKQVKAQAFKPTNGL